MSNVEEDIVSVEVRPFKHQVGGHTCVLQVGRSTICKPYIDREVWFYEHVPECLKSFIPTYLGATYVTCDLSENRKNLVAMIPRDVAARDGLVEIGKRSHDEETTVSVKRRKKTNGQIIKDGQPKVCWSDICVERQILRYGFWANNQPQKFILLENLVHSYQRPCMMDLKMGRRQYGEDSDAEKRKLLESRCAKTTSATLGFRICGSKTYQAASDSYTFHDKYFGRNLNDKEAEEEIRHFFHNGQLLRKDAIEHVIAKLDDLHDVLLSQTELYFHSASLLLLYDGATTNMSTDSSIDNSVSESTEKSKAGNQSKSDQSHQPLQSVQQSLNENEVSDSKTVESVKDNESSEGNSSNLHETIVKSCEEILDVKVDVRMIDFAHVSKNPTAVSDSSIVFGLKNLRAALQRLLTQTTV